MSFPGFGAQIRFTNRPALTGWPEVLTTLKESSHKRSPVGRANCRTTRACASALSVSSTSVLLVRSIVATPAVARPRSNRVAVPANVHHHRRRRRAAPRAVRGHVEPTLRVVILRPWARGHPKGLLLRAPRVLPLNSKNFATPASGKPGGHGPVATHSGDSVPLISKSLYAVHEFITSRGTRGWVGRRHRSILLCALCDSVVSLF